MAKAPIKVKTDLGTSPTVPARLTKAERDMVKKTAEGMARAIGAASRSRQIAAATHPLSVGDSTAVIGIGVGVPFAKLRDRGGYIAPKNRKILRFADGEFRPFARPEGIHYIRAAEEAFGPIIRLTYSYEFGRLT